MNMPSAAHAKHSSTDAPQEWIWMSAVWSLYSYRGDALVPSNTGTPRTKAGADVGAPWSRASAPASPGTPARSPARVASPRRRARARPPTDHRGRPPRRPARDAAACASADAAAEARGPSRRAERGRAPAIGGRARRDE